MPQPIGLFLFCIEFGWGWTKLIIDLCMNLLVGVEMKLHTEFGLKSFFFRIGSKSNKAYPTLGWVELGCGNCSDFGEG